MRKPRSRPFDRKWFASMLVAYVVLNFFGLATSLSTAVSAATPWDDAHVVWHMKEPISSGAISLPLSENGSAKLNVQLVDGEREASLKRGGDGCVARLEGGHFIVGKAQVDAFGDTFDREGYTLHLRVKSEGEQLDGCLFSRWAERDAMPIDFSAWRMPWGHLSTNGVGENKGARNHIECSSGAIGTKSVRPTWS